LAYELRLNGPELRRQAVGIELASFRGHQLSIALRAARWRSCRLGPERAITLTKGDQKISYRRTKHVENLAAHTASSLPADLNPTVLRLCV
jgi:hypothetical protein